MDFGDLLTPVHLVVLVVVALLVFGPGRLPELGGAVGRTITAFRHGMAGTAAPQRGPGTSEASTTERAPDPPAGADQGQPRP